MFCPECGTENNSKVKFCEQCGSELIRQASFPPNGKPLGIVVIVIVSIASGLAEIGMGAVIAVIPDLMGLAITSKLMGSGFESGMEASIHITSLKIAAIGIGLCTTGVLTLAASYGLWNFIGWGRVLAIMLYGTGLLVGVILFFTSLNAAQTAGSILLQVMGFVVTIWMITYLFRPHIREVFDGGGTARGVFAASLSTPIQSSPPR